MVMKVYQLTSVGKEWQDTVSFGVVLHPPTQQFLCDPRLGFFLPEGPGCKRMYKLILGSKPTRNHGSQFLGFYSNTQTTQTTKSLMLQKTTNSKFF